MMTVGIILGPAMALALLVWVVLGASAGRRQRSLHQVDSAAFYTLLSAQDDDYLRNELQPANYRKVRRQRLRAVQEYLIWIAEDCSILLAEMRSLPANSEPLSAAEVRLLAELAIKLRLLCLGYWMILWLEYAFPVVKLHPAAALASYETLRRWGDSHLRTQELPEVSA